MNRLKIAIVGCGKVAQLHAAALAKIEEAVLTAVYSKSAERARGFAQRYGAQPYDSLESLARSGVDAAIICSPHPEHAAACIELAAEGVHLLVEKPLASTLADCDAILDAARRGGVKVGTVSQRRFYAPVQRMQRAIASGKIGTPALGTVYMLGWRDEVYYRSDPWRGSWQGEGGGVMVNQAPHLFDLLLWCMGEVQEVFGAWANVNHPYIEVEDTAVAVIRFKSGALGNIVVSNSQKPGIYGKLHVHGQNGASVGVQADGGAMFVAGMTSILEPPHNDIWTVPGEEQLLEEWVRSDSEHFCSLSDPIEHYHRLQLEDFFRALLEDRRPLIDGLDGRRTVELFTAVYRSQRDGLPQRFPLTASPDDEAHRSYTAQTIAPFE